MRFSFSKMSKTHHDVGYLPSQLGQCAPQVLHEPNYLSLGGTSITAVRRSPARTLPAAPSQSYSRNPKPSHDRHPSESTNPSNAPAKTGSIPHIAPLEEVVRRSLATLHIIARIRYRCSRAFHSIRRNHGSLRTSKSFAARPCAQIVKSIHSILCVGWLPPPTAVRAVRRILPSRNRERRSTPRGIARQSILSP